MGRFLRQGLLFSFLIVGFNCTAQNGKEETWSTNFFTNIRTNYLSPDKDSVFSIPFRSIDFLDARFDTSSIGYTLHSNNYYRKLSVREGFGPFLQSKLLKDNTGRNGELGILCVIHHFKIMETDSVPEKEKGSKAFFNKLLTKIDIFINDNNQYRAAARFDTVFVDYDGSKENKDHILNLFARALSIKISNLNVTKTLTKKNFALSDIKESVDEKTNLPIIKATAYTKGVYLSFDEFVNNKPSYSDYKIKKGKFVDDIYIQGADSTPYIARNIFGYSDGKRFWIKLGNNVFLLHRTGNEFAFMAFSSIDKLARRDKPTQSAPGNTIIVDAGTLKGAAIGANMALDAAGLNRNAQRGTLDMQSFRPFVIDMEKGTIF